MSDWPKYESHKVVQAAKIISTHNDFGEGGRFLWVDPGTGVLEKFSPTVDAMFDKAEVGGYAMLYPDGFKSVSPKQAFEDGYTVVAAS
jgi:hypothetical protein